MPSSLLIQKFQISSQGGRDRIVQAYREIAQSNSKADNTTPRSMLCIPQDVQDELCVYVVEEVHQIGHFTSGLFEEVRSLVASELAEPGTCQSFSTFATLFRPEAASQTDPYIVFATLRYDSVESRDKALEGFGGVCEFSRREEPGTLWYNVLRDDAEPTQVRTLEMYIDKDYLWDPHAASDAVQDNKKRQGNTRLSTEFVFLKLIEARL